MLRRNNSGLSQLYGQALEDCMEKQKHWDRRRTRVELPTVEEAINAAQGLTPDPEQQARLAADLMGVSEAEVRPVMQKVAKHAPQVVRRSSTARLVIVERKVRWRTA
jgi:protein involved in polysaccharide export with SLBB domain